MRVVVTGASLCLAVLAFAGLSLAGPSKPCHCGPTDGCHCPLPPPAAHSGSTMKAPAHQAAPAAHREARTVHRERHREHREARIEHRETGGPAGSRENRFERREARAEHREARIERREARMEREEHMRGRWHDRDHMHSRHFAMGEGYGGPGNRDEMGGDMDERGTSDNRGYGPDYEEDRDYGDNGAGYGDEYSEGGPRYRDEYGERRSDYGERDDGDRDDRGGYGSGAPPMSINAARALDSWHGYDADCPNRGE